MSAKALVLLSGGLDSLLAAKILMDQRVKVSGLAFKSYFFSTKKGEAAAKQLGIPCRVIDFSQEHLEIVKNPPHGHGKAANPCVDCHLLMLKMARQIMKKKGYNFVATGEVLGERPFSQNKKALQLITKKSGLNDRLLRPLSAKLLSPTLPEKKGWVDREKVLAIQGRRRQPQMELAKKFGLTYPQPAGGCILTDKEFGKKLLDLFKKWPNCAGDDIKLLFLGRHFWHSEVTPARCADALLGGGTKRRTKIVLGKNQEENEKLEKLTKKGDVLITPTNFPGPTALIRGETVTTAAIKKSRSLILSYSKKVQQPQFEKSQA